MLDYALAKEKLHKELGERMDSTAKKRLDTMNRRNYFILKCYIESDLSIGQVAEEFCVSEYRVRRVADGTLPIIYPHEQEDGGLF